jgi:tripeptidyl-peptidase-1
LGHPPNGTTIDLHIALKPQRENVLIDALHEVSQPGNPKYGAHLTKEQVAQLVAPHPDTLGIVNSWLEYNADKLLGASYRLYRHAETNDTIL